MTGREAKTENDLFFVCSLIESVARKTKNMRKDIVNKLGLATIRHYLELADVYHCESMDNLVLELVEKCSIATGTFDNVADCRYRVPTPFDIGKVYKRLIVSVAQNKNFAFSDALMDVYNSWISPKIDDYNSSMYFENPDYLFQSYLAGEPLKD
ncbi:MAG: hypothetical protein LBQ66_12565 [Planctomycetaceae bacterium]|jgi:hypothetical protein|nr:hypothetical protein [Planctomycetaceae bacterium]